MKVLRKCIGKNTQLALSDQDHIKNQTMIRNFPHGLEKKHACKWIAVNFPGISQCQHSWKTFRNPFVCTVALQSKGEGPLEYQIQGINLSHTLKKIQVLSPWIGEQPCMQQDFLQFSRSADICDIPGKLSETYLHARLFSNPPGKVILIVGILFSPDLRVQHI